MKIKSLLIIPAIILLTGCASDSKSVVDLHLHYITADSAPIEASDTNAQNQLAESAASVGSSLQELSAIQMTTNPQAKMPDPINAKQVGMAQQVSIDWNGPVEPILKQIADDSHYTLRVIGDQPAIPVLVSITAKQQVLADVFRNLQLQVSNYAKIQLYPDSKTIELRYAAN